MPIWIAVIILGMVVNLPVAGLHQSKQSEPPAWSIASTASALSEWLADQVLAEYSNISARVLSVRDDGIFIDAGSDNGAMSGQVFEIYRAPHNGGPDEIIGEVQISWTEEDYSFAEPRRGLRLDNVTSLHFARLVNIQPIVSLLSDVSGGDGESELHRVVQAVHGFLSIRGAIRPVMGTIAEPSWRLLVTQDFEGTMIRASLRDPGGEISGTISVDPFTGDRVTGQAWLDPSYLTGVATPFEHFMAPPGRRMVRIACGAIVPGTSDELVVLDGTDLWIYDLSRSEPRLLSTHTVTIPPGPVRHRDDAGSLELVDLDDNGQVEICLAPPGGSRGEIWAYSGDDWVQFGFLAHPPRAVDARTRGVVIAPYSINSPILDNGLLYWDFPLSEMDPEYLTLAFPVTDMASVPGSGSWLPTLAVLDTEGTLYLAPHQSEMEALDGEWGNLVRIVMYRNGPIALVTAPTISSDILTLLDLYSGVVLQEFPVSEGPIIDVALGDIDSDGKAEILVAVLAEEGVKIYY